MWLNNASVAILIEIANIYRNHYLRRQGQVWIVFIKLFIFSEYMERMFLKLSPTQKEETSVASLLDSQSRHPGLKTTRWLQGQLILSSFWYW